jgi:PAS domain-containing protein
LCWKTCGAESWLPDTALDDLAGPPIIYVNRAWLQMTGYDHDEIAGKTPGILQGKPDMPPLDSAKVTSAGFLISEKQYGPFQIDLSWIKTASLAGQ